MKRVGYSARIKPSVARWRIASAALGNGGSERGSRFGCTELDLQSAQGRVRAPARFPSASLSAVRFLFFCSFVLVPVPVLSGLSPQPGLTHQRPIWGFVSWFVYSLDNRGFQVGGLADRGSGRKSLQDELRQASPTNPSSASISEVFRPKMNSIPTRPRADGADRIARRPRRSVASVSTLLREPLPARNGS